MVRKNLTANAEEIAEDYASKYCVDKKEDVHAPHNELSPFRKFICVGETIIMGYILFTLLSTFVGHLVDLWDKLHFSNLIP